MGDPFSGFSNEELICFFAVLVRLSTLLAVMPVFGDRFVPGPVKILLSLAASFVIFPALLNTGAIRPADAVSWGASTTGLGGVVLLEALAGLVLGFTSRLLFEAFSFAGNLAGTYMGFSSATFFDPHMESQSQVVAELQMALVTLMFLALDGHHLLLKSALGSYQWLPLGGVSVTEVLSSRLIEMTAEVVRLGVQLSAPVGIAIFTVSVAFGIMSKAMPQMNILVLSFAVTSLVGLLVMFLEITSLAGTTLAIFERAGDWIRMNAQAMAVATSR